MTEQHQDPLMGWKQLQACRLFLRINVARFAAKVCTQAGPRRQVYKIGEPGCIYMRLNVAAFCAHA